jgi:aspartate carbamoyltransferase catalytic subunit
MDMLSMREVSKSLAQDIFVRAARMEKGDFERREGVLSTLFFEASTRTKSSFLSAGLRLGLKTIDFPPERSSLSKGESFSDTIRMFDNYSDIMAIRHPREGSARLAAKIAAHPVINGGDGANEHPSQALIDLYTIKKEKKKIEGLKVALFGDLKHARAMHSLMQALALFGADMRIISPPGLEPSYGIMDRINSEFGIKLKATHTPDFSGCDVIYVVRVQEERFVDKYEAKQIKDRFRIKLADVEQAKKDVIIMHPLPKIDEITPDIDASPYAKYYAQASNAVPVRMAIMDKCLESKEGVR